MDSENKKIFRTRMFGGFHKTDVSDYIESAANKSNEEIDDLKKEIEANNKEKQALSDQNAQLLEQIAAFERDKVQKDEEVINLKDQLQKENQTVSELREQIAQYDKMKADIAGIELAARKRARDIEQESLSALDKMKAEANLLLQATKERVSGFVASISEQVAQAETTLDSAKSGYKSLLMGLSGLKEKLYDLKAEDEPEPLADIVVETESETEDSHDLHESYPEKEPDADELFHSYIDETTNEQKHLSLKDMMDRLRNK